MSFVIRLYISNTTARVCFTFVNRMTRSVTGSQSSLGPGAAVVSPTALTSNRCETLCERKHTKLQKSLPLPRRNFLRGLSEVPVSILLAFGLSFREANSRKATS